jgi:catechol 2,3-dioxygenase-like lactoylglutathione lyase family enzyme
MDILIGACSSRRMTRRLDHVVLWVQDPLASVDFYEKVVGFPGVRVAEFRAGKAPFPSVRISDDAIIDLMKREAAPMLNAMAAMGDEKAADSAGHPVNHVCVAMSQEEFDELRRRLTEAGREPRAFLTRSFGARGVAPNTFYFTDLDGNVLEARYYAE